MLLYTDQVMLIEALSKQLGSLLNKTKLKIATAESCTGGWIAQAVSQVEGSSAWFDRGFVPYTNEALREMLSVKVRSLNKHGAVSEAIVLEMAAGALKKSHANFAVAISGVADQDASSQETPVGKVWVAWNIDGNMDASCMHLPGERRDICAAAVIIALQGLLVRIRNWLDQQPNSEKEIPELLDEIE